MRWKARNRVAWRRWFAWRPIRIAGWWIWLEYVERSFGHHGQTRGFGAAEQPIKTWAYRPCDP